MHASAIFTQQYQAFMAISAALGFGAHIPRYDSIRSKATVLTGSTHENANGYELKFFQETTQPHEVDKQQEPSIQNGGTVAQMQSNEHIFMVRGIDLELMNQNATTLTETELNEIANQLVDHILEVKFGTQIVFKDRVKRVLSSGVGRMIGNDNAATALVARAPVIVPEVPFVFDEPIILAPGTSLSARLIGNDTWVTTDNFELLLQLPGLVCSKGSPPKLGKGSIYTLSGVAADLNAVKDAIEKGA